MNKLKHKYWPSLIIWVIIILAAIITMPNVSQIVRTNSTIKLPSNLQSQVAKKIATKASNKGNIRTLIAVYNKTSGKLTSENTTQIADTVHQIKNDHNLDVVSVTAPSDNAQSKKQLTSKDKTTQIVMITLKAKDKVSTQTNRLLKRIKTPGLKTYITGTDILNDDFSTVVQNGIKRTEAIAIIFIFIVLILVFRSPIVPLISLATVGVSFITALNVVMNLADKFNFPISNFTQVFMVIVMFGIGTDYNILLYDRYKEALSKEQSVYAATKEARKSAGRTILYSGSTVLIGFTVLGLAKFSIYRSAVGVAIGVAILLVVLLTLNMFFMATLGKRMFWPAKIEDVEGNSKLWHLLSRTTLKHPYTMVAIVLIVLVPMLFNTNQTLNFNDADELPNTVQSKAGYEVIQRHYPKGMSGPSTLYIENKKPLNTQAQLATIDELTEYLKAEPGVKTVFSATQPGGEKINQLYLKSQLSQLIIGLNQASTGLKAVQNGLNAANNQLTNANLGQSLSQVQALANGSNSLQTGAQALNQGIQAYTAGVSQLASGASQLGNGSLALSGGVSQLSSSAQALSAGAQQLQAQTAQISAQAPALASLMLKTGATGAASQIQGMSALSGGVSQLANGSSALSQGVGQLQGQLPTYLTGIQSLSQGASQLDQNSSQLVSGSVQVASGASQVNQGVQTLNTKMQQLGSQVQSLQDGLTSANHALDQIDNGTNSIKQYLSEMQSSYMANTFYMPKAFIKNEIFKPSLDTYMSKDRKITQMMIVLKGDPSTQASAQRIREIRSDITSRLKNTSLENAKVAMGGQTSQTADLQDTANGDFIRTVVIMVIGIGLALLVVTRSLIQQLTIEATLIITYISALGATRILSGWILNKPLLTWNTPFFSFIMLIALGVDYSIFLMMRYRGDAVQIPDVRKRILHSATVIGAVVISAAIILSGTFAALIPSGVATLIQVAITVIIGLIILVFVLPIVMSAMVRWTYPYVKDKMYDKKNPLEQFFADTFNKSTKSEDNLTKSDDSKDSK